MVALAGAAILGTLAAGIGIGVVTCLHQPARVRNRLLLVVLVALALRVALALLLHGLGAWHITARGAVTPDEAVIDYGARLRAGGDARSPVVLGGSLHTAWLLLAAAVYELWNDLLAIKLVNAVLGALLVVPAFLLGRDLHSERAGMWAAWSVAVFPNALVWSALALREPLIALVITTLVLIVLRTVRATPSVRRLAGGCAMAVSMLVVLGFTRSYMVPLMMVLVVVAGGLAAACRRSVAPLLVAVGIAASGIIAISLLPTGPELVRTTLALAGEQAPSIYNPFSDCSDESACLAADAGPPREALGAPATGAAEPAEPSAPPSLTDSLQSVGQKGFVRAGLIAVLAGRPVWRTDEFFFLLQPGVVVWWIMVPLVPAGMAFLLVRRRLPEFALLGGLIGSVLVFLAYSGQFIRHHFMLEPLAVVLAAVAVVVMIESGHRRLRAALFAACSAMGTAAAASVAASLV